MKDLKIRFVYDQELTFSQFSNSIYHMNRAINLSKRLDNVFAEKLNAVDEFSQYDLSEIYRQINENKSVRNDNPVVIQKITTNSPIEITINIDCYVHIAIILLGGRRIDSNIYEIPIRIIEKFRDLLKGIREHKKENE
jgi:hypothetical protein